MTLWPLVPPARASSSPKAWRWPLDGHPRILRRFTPPPEPWLAGHRGIDLAVPASTAVFAPGPGTVRFAGPVAGKGVITIDHGDGLRTTYQPVSPSVRRGQPVTLGAKLGVIEPTISHCPESCLHWGLRRDNLYLDPLLLLGRAPIRLLPFWPPPTPQQAPASPHSDPTTNQAPPPAIPRPQYPGPIAPSEPVIITDTASTPPHNQEQITPSPAPSPHGHLEPHENHEPHKQSPTSLQTPAYPSQRNTQFLTRSASTLTAPAIVLGTLLGAATVITLITLLITPRRRRHTRKISHQGRRPIGQHRKHHRHRRPPRRRRPPPDSRPPPK
ncbi:M23 family metallopeptidase [Nonomuraea sp. NPDC046802]|uniref:murein hydrolase activator EnvC family protein n=1 Tax=Nonomuraea sp. NPDC046802 TaxID=3154919 RepID=UPI0033C9CA18